MQNFGLDLSFLNSLGSDFNGLNDNLIAKIYPVKRVVDGDTVRFERNSKISVHAPVLDGSSLEYQFMWQSSFEDSGTNSKIPALVSLLQSGTITSAVSKVAGDENIAVDTLEKAHGRTGITKLNSTQVFTGMQPVKLTLKLLFRAKYDAISEVVNPIKQLLEWASPQKLSKTGALVNVVEATQSENKNDGLVDKAMNVVLPSLAPQMIALKYKGRLYSPLVIESVSEPLDSPIDKYGNYASCELDLTLGSLEAWDKDDIYKIYNKEFIK